MSSPRLVYAIIFVFHLGMAGLIYLRSRQTIEIENPLEPSAMVSQSKTATSFSSALATQENRTLDFSIDSDGLTRSQVLVKTLKGNFSFALYANDAPLSSRRIVELVQKGFYNGLAFHRVLPKYLVQTGDPQGDGFGGSGRNLRAEFSQKSFEAGTVAMARGAEENSADSQFFIMLADAPDLVGQYTVVGKVRSGLDVLGRIEKGDRIEVAEFGRR